MKWYSKVTQDDKQCHCSIYHAGLPLAFHGIYIPSLVLFRYSKILVKNSQFVISYLHLAPIEGNLVGILQIFFVSYRKLIRLLGEFDDMWSCFDTVHECEGQHTDRHTRTQTDRQTDRHFTVWLTVLQQHIAQLHKMCRALKTNT